MINNDKANLINLNIWIAVGTLANIYVVRVCRACGIETVSTVRFEKVCPIHWRMGEAHAFPNFF